MSARRALDIDALIAAPNPSRCSRGEHIRLLTGYYEAGLINGSESARDARH